VNDRYDGYAGDQYELIGYDANGQPVYRQVPHQRSRGTGGQPTQAPRRPPQQGHGGYDPYGTAPYGSQDPYGRDEAYGTGPQPTVPPQDGYGTGRRPVASPQNPYGTAQQPTVSPYDPRTGQQPVVPPQDVYGTGQQPVAAPQGPYGTAGGPGAIDDRYDPSRPSEERGWYSHGPATDTRAQSQPPRERGPGPGQQAPSGDGYGTEQFSFVEEQDEDSEDVIDWLKFTESRTERREEARRRARSRVIALVVVLALAFVGGIGYLWQAGKLPALPGSESGAGTTQESGPQNRDVIVVHLHNTRGGGTSTALLVDNTTTKHGTTILLPNTLALTGDDGTSTTLGKSVADDGSTGTRESVDTLLGTRIEGTWRLDTPYLDTLVELVGNIDITTDTDVPDPAPKKGAKDAKGSSGGKGTPQPLVKKGEGQTLSGPMAVAYATYRAPGEPETAQLSRFGQVMQGVLRKLSSDPQSATVTVQTLAQILDPSLGDKDLGAFLAKLADHAKGGDYRTTLLPVQQDGTLSEEATDRVVKDMLGGTVKGQDQGAAVRVGVKNATGAKPATEAARVALVNGGYTFVDGASAIPQASSQVTYADEANKQEASEVAKTLGLPTGAVQKGKVAANADISVLLGQDYDYQDASGQ
jgi:anionic cell wall polymer biosynthesis LytR-Cps2A-Psr (LCP) family protein